MDKQANTQVADIEQKILIARISELPSEDLLDMECFIDALKAGDEEALYQCWREKLDAFNVIPDELLGKEFVSRYLAERGRVA